MKINKDILSTKGAVVKFCEGYSQFSEDVYAGVIADIDGNMFGVSMKYLDDETVEIKSHGDHNTELV